MELDLGTLMIRYRLYFLNELGHRAEALDLQYEDDEQVTAAAEGLEDRRPREIWEGGRLVAMVFKPPRQL